MGKDAITSVVTILTAIIGVAIIAVLVGSPNTSSVIGAAGSSFSQILGVAVSPATGGVGANFGALNTANLGLGTGNELTNLAIGF